MKLSSAIIAGFVVAINAQQHGEKSAEGFGDWFEATHPDSKDGSSICDRYAGSILGANTLETQQLLITLFVNTALVGNYTTPNVGIRVPGIIWPGEFQGKPINQMPYFDGSLASSNVGKDLGHGQAINWLDGGGPAALRSNVSAFNVTSNQFRFVTHLHEYFGYLLRCSEYGNTAHRYSGDTRMYHVHKYMTYSNFEETYTNLQFVLSAASLGFQRQDLGAIGGLLEWLFSKRCSPPKSIPYWAEPALQAICIEEDCPIHPAAVCDEHDPIIEPRFVNSSQIYDEH